MREKLLNKSRMKQATSKFVIKNSSASLKLAAKTMNQVFRNDLPEAKLLHCATAPSQAFSCIHLKNRKHDAQKHTNDFFITLQVTINSSINAKLCHAAYR